MATKKLAGVSEKLREILKCAACHTVPQYKVLQCPKGHLTCEPCSWSTSHCSMRCMGSGNPDWIRNLAMEEAIQGPHSIDNILASKTTSDFAFKSLH